MTRALVLAIVLATGAARANVWQRASDPAAAAVADVYDDAMRQGDELASRATARSATLREIEQLVQHAVDAYKVAAKARPGEGEPWYRIGQLLYDFYFDCTNDRLGFLPPPSLLCDNAHADHKHGNEAIAAWDEFEKRAPLDPRVSYTDSEGAELLFERAIIHTKLVDPGDTKDNLRHLEGAARDYKKIIDRIDSSMTGTEFYEEVVGNLAETYMMLDKLDDAIETYREALRHGASVATTYGLAVALDRDERGGEAFDVIRRVGEEEVSAFQRAVMIEDKVFFVPKGEAYYYFGLLEEAWGHYADAAKFWQLYIASGAHPEFQPRAKQHLDALQAKHIRREVPHLDWLDE